MSPNVEVSTAWAVRCMRIGDCSYSATINARVCDGAQGVVCPRVGCGSFGDWRPTAKHTAPLT